MGKLLKSLNRIRRTKRISFTDNYHLGVFCGESIFSIHSWRGYRLFDKRGNSISVGPILFWREYIPK